MGGRGAGEGWEDGRIGEKSMDGGAGACDYAARDRERGSLQVKRREKKRRWLVLPPVSWPVLKRRKGQTGRQQSSGTKLSGSTTPPVFRFLTSSHLRIQALTLIHRTGKHQIPPHLHLESDILPHYLLFLRQRPRLRRQRLPVRPPPLHNHLLLRPNIIVERVGESHRRSRPSP